MSLILIGVLNTGGNLATLEQKLNQMISPTIESLGFELVGIETFRAGRFLTVRIYLDKEGGISIDDCSSASRQISAILDVEDPISDKYNLEVSSPGLDRPLFTIEHFKRFIDKKVSIHLRIAINNRRKYTGIIKAVENDTILLDVDGIEQKFIFGNIQKANLVPTF